jgi:hypothetical protein
MRGYSITEVLGSIAKWAAIVVVFGFSITLSYMFFLSITPHDKSWFTFTGLGLTEGGFLLWMAVFMLTRHDPVYKAIALVMACLCAFTSVVVAGYEFYALLSSEFALAHNALVIQAISIGIPVGNLSETARSRLSSAGLSRTCTDPAQAHRRLLWDARRRP